MWKTYLWMSYRYPKISLNEERQIIAQAMGALERKEKNLFFAMSALSFFGFIRRYSHLTWRVMGRIFFPRRYLFCMIKSKPMTWNVRINRAILNLFIFFCIWKRIDGLIIDSVKKEIKRERCKISLDWERYGSEVATF
jgi:hypothetical protein